ncbi:hypothetical protein CHY_0838 [Carboxydothermus hydrogenoformans Z-2901]|uniref:Uncharacterized protein n=1 Tax=Carboxydothermus hydrogenoformans (strain ATCC BAA-161 / DSM 6008 / Z-2901) TaxID=246194 RepID=Q3ADU4_CARHZ|nr:hypothetical protein CHY_0838 [Carboxydothermus hydrogenoformans Z-2901]
MPKILALLQRTGDVQACVRKIRFISQEGKKSG